MISTSFHQSLLLPSANTFSSGDNSKLTPSCIRFRQSASFSVATTSCTSVASCVPLSISPASFYEVLGIPIGATIEEIKTAYRRLARVCHPDVAAIDQKESYADEFMKVHIAYCTLSDPGKRADYDRRLFPRHRTDNVYSANTRRRTGNVYSANTCRNWETDQCW